MRIASAFGFLLALGIVAFPQPPLPEFEAASLKPAKSSDARKWKGGPGTNDPGQFQATMDLRSVARLAWDLRRYQVVAPTNMEDVYISIMAKVPAATDQQTFRRMLQQLLITRMRLVASYQMREVPAYDLVIARGGAKLQSAEPAPPSGPREQPTPPSEIPVIPTVHDKQGNRQIPPGRPRFLVESASGKTRYMVRMMPMEKILPTIADALGRPVVDKTGLAGDYDFVLEFSYNLSADPTVTDLVSGGSPNAPPLQSALEEQLGLKLRTSKTMEMALTISSFSKTPVEN